MEKSKPTKLIILDTETSGLFYDQTTKLAPQILQLACLVVDWETLEVEDSLKLNIRFQEIDEWQSNLKLFYWSEDAFKIHGIPKEQYGFSLVEALCKFHDFVLKYFSKSNFNIKFCGWNVKYDIDILNINMSKLHKDNMIWRLGSPRFSNIIFQTKEFLNKTKTFDLASVGFAIGVNNSNDLCKLLNIDRKNHDALEDCYMCLEFLKFLRGKDVK